MNSSKVARAAALVALVGLAQAQVCIPEGQPVGSCDTRGYGDPDAEGPVVRGIALRCYRELSGDTSVPVDFAARPLEAYALDGSAWEPASISYGSHGKFTIDVPEGTTYAVKLTGPYTTSYLVTSARSIDLSTSHIGRHDAQPLDGGTASMSLSVSNLAPWAEGDQFTLASDTTPDVYAINPSYAAGGETSFVDPAPMIWSMSGLETEMDPAKGDRAMLLQMHQVSGGTNVGAPFSIAAVRAFDFDPLSLRPGVTTVLQGAMTAPAQKAFTADVRFSEIVTMAAQVHPAATPISSAVFVDPVPGTLDRGWIGFTGDLLVLEAADPTQDLSGTFSYANPRDSWSEMVQVSAAFSVRVALGSTTPTRVNAFWAHYEPASAMSGKTVGITMTPPQSLQVDGADGHTNGALSSATPLLTWTAPELGTPNGYRIIVYRLEVSGTRTVRRLATTLYTTQPELRVPPGVLASGQTYVFYVDASSMGPPHDFASRPFYDSTTYDAAATLSGMWLAP